MVNLNDIMEFEHVIEIHEDGSISEPSGVYAPDYRNDVVTDPKWFNYAKGYTGQYGGSSPMHNSEFIGGSLARDIMDDPGIYVAVVCDWDCDDDCELDEYGECQADHAEGWTVLKLRD